MEQQTCREQWLMNAVEVLRPLFKQHGYDSPVNVKVACGFPSRGGLSQRKRTIGQCWDHAQSEAKVFELFISPVIAEPVEVLAVLAHEMVHATVGLKAGHKGPFKRCATAIGLEGKMTSTTPGKAFTEFAKDSLKSIGEYPHGQLNASARLKKEGTRLIKCTCPQCGYTARTTRVWIDGPGAPICPACEIQTEAA